LKDHISKDPKGIQWDKRGKKSHKKVSSYWVRKTGRNEITHHRCFQSHKTKSDNKPTVPRAGGERQEEKDEFEGLQRGAE